MTDKYCRKTGKKAELISSVYIKPNAFWCAGDYYGILRYVCSPCDYNRFEKELLRDGTRLEELLDNVG